MSGSGELLYIESELADTVFPDKASYVQYQRRRRWALCILTLVFVPATIFLGIPAWMIAFAKATGFGFGWVATRLIRPAQSWFDRSRLARREGEPHGVLGYSRSALIIASVYTAFFGIFAALEFGGLIAFVQFAGFPLYALIFIGCGGAALLTLAICFSMPIVGYFRVRHEVGPETLRYQTLFGCGVLSWEDVKLVGYSQWTQSFWVETTDGTMVRVSTNLTGISEFAMTVLRYVPWPLIDGTARKTLKLTACGNLPRGLL